MARLLPTIRLARPDLPAPSPLPPEEERRRLFEAITQCLVALDAGPIALFVDDVHWADRATLDWLDYLVHRLEGRSLLLVAAYRAEDAPPALVQLAARWAREGLARRLAPPRLDAAESAALAAALQVDPAVRDRIREQSAGNPYFLIELSHAPAGDVPPALGELIRARVARLPDAARQVLQAAAVLEPGIAFAPLRRTSGRGEEETLDALDVLLDAGILVEQAGRYAFAHPLVAAVVREDLSAARRAFLNRRAAEAVAAAHPGAPDAVAGQLAAYYAAAGEPARAAGMAARAASRALDLGAPAEAIAFYRQALDLDPAPARRMDLAHALFWSGDLDAARTAYQAAFDAFLASGDRPGAARACLGVAETLMPAGRVPEAVAWIERSLTYADPQADPATYALARFLTGPSRLAADRPLAEVQTALAEATRLARDHHLPGMLARGRFALGTMLAERGDLAGAVQAYRDSIVLAEQAGDTFQALLSYNNTAYHALLLGDLAQAHAYVETGLAQAEARGLRVPLQYLYSTRGEIALAEHDWDGAEAWFRRGLAEAQAMGNLTQAANYQANLGLAAQGRGDLDAAARQLEIARGAAARVPAIYLQAQIDLWLAAVQQARGASAEAALAHAARLIAGRGFGRLEAELAHLRGDTPAPIPAAQPALPPG